MTSSIGVMKPFSRIQRLVWLQRGLRLTIRAFWLGLSAWLVAWSCHMFWGFPSSPLVWAISGAGVLLLNLAVIPFRKPSLRSLTWTIDRRFGSKEQISTGFMVAESTNDNSLKTALVEDAANLLITIHKRVWKKGWRLFPDLISLLVVLGLFLSVSQVEYIQPEIRGYHPEQERMRLPALGADPRMQYLVKAQSNQTELNENDAELEPDAGSNQPSEERLLEEWINSGGEIDPQKYKTLIQKLEQIGNLLNQDVNLYEISQGLSSGDLETTADAVEILSNQLDKMTIETRQQIENILLSSGDELSAQGLPKTGETLKQAAEDLTLARQQGDISLSTDIVAAKEHLDQISALMRDMSDQLKEQQSPGTTDGEGTLTSRDESGTVVSSVDQAKPKEITRLSGTGEIVELTPSDQSGISLPGPSSSESSKPDTQNSTDLSSFSVSDRFYINYIVPYFYPWKWHDVVSNYFRRD